MKKIKKDQFISFYESLNRDSNLNYIWKKIKCFKIRFNFTETNNKYDPSLSQTILDQIDEVGPFWAPVNSITLRTDPVSDPITLGFFDSLFSPEELNYVIRGLRLNFSPGIDGIDYRIISQFTPPIRQFLLALLNIISSTHAFPDS